MSFSAYDHMSKCLNCHLLWKFIVSRVWWWWRVIKIIDASRPVRYMQSCTQLQLRLGSQSNCVRDLHPPASAYFVFHKSLFYYLMLRHCLFCHVKHPSSHSSLSAGQWILQVIHWLFKSRGFTFVITSPVSISQAFIRVIVQTWHHDIL